MKGELTFYSMPNKTTALLAIIKSGRTVNKYIINTAKSKSEAIDKLFQLLATDYNPTI